MICEEPASQLSMHVAPPPAPISQQILLWVNVS